MNNNFDYQRYDYEMSEEEYIEKYGDMAKDMKEFNKACDNIEVAINKIAFISKQYKTREENESN